jgi:putative ABC transport system permease protein
MRELFSRRYVSNSIRDILYAVREFRRAPLVAITVVATVALGLGLVTVAFTLLNMFLFGVDHVPNVEEMYAVERPRTSAGQRPPFTRAEFDALRRETNVFTDLFAQVSDVDSRVDGRPIFGTFATANLFQVLSVHAAMGRTLTPGDDEPTARHAVVVLSHRGWDRLFSRDPAILSRSLLLNGVTFDIVGVMPDGFRGLAAGPPDDYWAPLSMLGDIRPVHRGHEATVAVSIIGRLRPGMSRQTALAGLAVWDAHQLHRNAIEHGEATITLVPKWGTVDEPREAVLVTAPLFFAFGLILLIGCANVANLLLARGVARQREIGIRLSLGATRGRIVLQLLTESLLMALIAAAAGFTISRLVLGAILNAMVTSMPPDIGDIRLLVPATDWRVLLFLVGGAAVSTIAFALVPALQSTRVEPLRTMRGEVFRDARPGRARNILIGIQVAASALLLISAAVFLRSALTATIDDPGMRISDTVIIPIANEQNRNAVVQAVTTDPNVGDVAASWPMAVDGAAAPSARAETVDAKAAVAYEFVSPEYFSVLDIAIVRGRGFTSAERAPNLSLAIVSQTAARALWPNADAIGQVINLAAEPRTETTGRIDEPRLESRAFTVIGIARDVAGFRIAPFTKAVVYVPTSAATPHTALIARVHGDPELARQQLSNRLTTIDANSQVGTMLWVTRMETYFLQLGFWFTVVLGGLALTLTLSGLFGVLSYLVEQRTKEIGVRMALGATVPDVARLVVWQSIQPVGVGLLIGGGSAAALAALLLSTPAAAGIGAIVHVLDPVAYAAGVSIIITACLVAASIPAARAARLDPTVTLRQE